MIIIIATGPKAMRNAYGRSAARLSRLAQPTTGAVRIRVLANTAESQAARAASRFDVFAARERTSSFSNLLIRAQAEGPILAQGVTLTRFVRAREFVSIREATAVGSPVTLGQFFTPDSLLTVPSGTAQLSLGGLQTRAVVAFIRVPASEFRGIPFRGPSLVQPQFGQIGSGLEVEFLVRPTIPSGSIIVVPVGAP